MAELKAFCAILTLFCWINCGTTSENKSKSESCNTITTISAIPGRMTSLKDKIYFNAKNFSVFYNDSRMFFSVSTKENNMEGITIYNNTTSKLNISNGTCSLNISIQILPCPPGFTFIKKQCQCDFPPVSEFPVFKCDNSSLKASVFIGYCIGEAKHRLVVTGCPLTLNERNGAYIPLKRTPNGSLDFCKKFKRRGELCKNCTKNHSISVYSDIFECIKCNKPRWITVMKYVAIEIIPATIFFLLVLYFHIGITSGPANGFIFFAQATVLPFEIIYLKYIAARVYMPIGTYLPTIIIYSVVMPYSIFNLDFYRLFRSPDLCFSAELRAIDILALRYVSLLYPLVLLVISYIIIELQAINIRPVLWMLKIICFPCMRWRRVWKAKISILDAFATYVLLTYTKAMYITFLLLSKSKVYGKKSDYYVLSFDPSIEIYSKEHVPFLMVAVVVFLTYGLFPPLILMFYQCKTCYSFLERLRLKRPGLDQFVLAFQGCYRDGTNGTGDRRCFAGLYFVFRLIVVLILTQSNDTVTALGLKAIAFSAFTFIFAMAQPYKQAKYTFIDSSFFFILFLLSYSQCYAYIQLQVVEKSSRVLLFGQFLVYIPITYMIIYVARWLFVYIKNRDQNRYHLLLNDGVEHKDALTNERGTDREPAQIDISPRVSITRTEVSIAELSQENSGSESDETEDSPLLGKRREMQIFSQHAATLSEEYRLARNI